MVLDGEEHFEVDGIREHLPAGEYVLWQGKPTWRGLAVRAMHVRGVALYFGVLVAARIGFALADGASVGAALGASTWLLAMGVTAVAILVGVAWLSARTTYYAITTRRVVMRVGMALPIIVNLPYKEIKAAALKTFADGEGDIPLRLKGDVRLAYAHLWPHARPWQLRHPEPMMRSVPKAADVARTLADALAASAGSASQWAPEAGNPSPTGKQAAPALRVAA